MDNTILHIEWMDGQKEDITIDKFLLCDSFLTVYYLAGKIEYFPILTLRRFYTEVVTVTKTCAIVDG